MTSPLELQDTIDRQSAEIGRLKGLCKVLASAEANHDPHGMTLRALRVENAELQLSLRNAWDELERKQKYLESAVQANASLREQMSGASPADAHDGGAANTALATALSEARAELRAKSLAFDAAQTTIQNLSQELQSMREESQKHVEDQTATLTASLHEAWAELTRKQGFLEDAVQAQADMRTEFEKRIAELEANQTSDR